MPKYSVMLLVDASITFKVEAESAEQAAELAMAQAPNPSVCHQCSDEVSVGEIIEVAEVLELDDNGAVK